MNDLELKPRETYEVVIGEEKEIKMLGSYYPKVDGGKIFEYNPKDGIISEVNKSEIQGKKVFTNKDCYYVEAINIKNAIKKLKKGVLICKT